jgi:hypothetical protein
MHYQLNYRGILPPIVLYNGTLEDPCFALTFFVQGAKSGSNGLFLVGPKQIYFETKVYTSHT